MTKAKKQLKQLKAKTAANYTTRQLWAAVLRRSDHFRREAGGAIYRKHGDRFEYHAAAAFDRALAIEALIDIEGINLSPAGAYQMVMES